MTPWLSWRINKRELIQLKTSIEMCCFVCCNKRQRVISQKTSPRFDCWNVKSQSVSQSQCPRWSSEIRPLSGTETESWGLRDSSGRLACSQSLVERWGAGGGRGVGREEPSGPFTQTVTQPHLSLFSLFLFLFSLSLSLALSLSRSLALSLSLSLALSRSLSLSIALYLCFSLCSIFPF